MLGLGGPSSEGQTCGRQAGTELQQRLGGFTQLGRSEEDKRAAWKGVAGWTRIFSQVWESALHPHRVGKIPLEKEMATHSSILAWRIPWTEAPSRLAGRVWDGECAGLGQPEPHPALLSLQAHFSYHTSFSCLGAACLCFSWR